jgi:glycosyltransferase involved in cell wall biosynthesis
MSNKIANYNGLTKKQKKKMPKKTIVIICLFPLMLLLLLLIANSEAKRYKYKISVVMPVYNTEAYLDKSIKSVLNQTMRDFELIIVNDASSDNSLNIINKYAAQDKRIRVINMPQNSGAAAARNEGIKYIEGKFSLFVDSDDVLQFNMLQKMYDEALKRNLDIVVCDAIVYDHEMQRISYDNAISSSLLQLDYLKNKKLTTFSYLSAPYTFFQICNKVPWNKLIKTSLIKKHNLQFDNTPKHNDTLFITKALVYAKRIGVIPDKLYVYNYKRSGSISDKNPSPDKELYEEIFGKVKKFLIQENLYEKLQTSFLIWYKSFTNDDEE